MNLLEAIELHLPPGFRIQTQIGRGGTSAVYLAAAPTGERLVVKVMHPGTIRADAVDRFLGETRILRLLEHPRIVPIVGSGEANGALFFTMPYVEGETLRTRLRAEGPLPPPMMLRVARDITEALGHAHAQGIVHRDVKPENILLTPDGSAYLMDFGFARSPERDGGDGARWDAGLLVGTPEYMSPEQITGRLPADWRTDFYSLGCVMYEMLVGGLPFPATSKRAAMERRLHANAPDVREARPDVPDDVAAIVRRCLDPHASGRYATAGMLVLALEAALGRHAGDPGDAAPAVLAR